MADLIATERYLMDFSGLSAAESQQQSDKIREIRSYALGSLTALAQIVHEDLRWALAFHTVTVDEEKMVRVEAIHNLIERIESIVDRVNEEYQPIRGEDLVNLKKR
jgi:hypothetical protein